MERQNCKLFCQIISKKLNFLLFFFPKKPHSQRELVNLWIICTFCMGKTILLSLALKKKIDKSRVWCSPLWEGSWTSVFTHLVFVMLFRQALPLVGSCWLWGGTTTAPSQMAAQALPCQRSPPGPGSSTPWSSPLPVEGEWRGPITPPGHQPPAGSSCRTHGQTGKAEGHQIPILFYTWARQSEELMGTAPHASSADTTLSILGTPQVPTMGPCIPR